MIVSIVRHHVSSDHFKAAMAQMGHAYGAMPEVVYAEVAAEGWSPMTEVQGSADD